MAPDVEFADPLAMACSNGSRAHRSLQGRRYISHTRRRVGSEKGSPCFDVRQMRRIAPDLDRVAQRGHPRPARHRWRVRVGAVAEINGLSLAVPGDGRRRALVVRPSAKLRVLNSRRVVRQKDRAVDIARVGPEVVYLFVGLVPIRQRVDGRVVDQLGEGLFDGKGMRLLSACLLPRVDQ